MIRVTEESPPTLQTNIRNSMIFLQYPPCSTCQKAKRWLREHGIDCQERHIVDNKPSIDELRTWLQRSGLPLKKLFNTSGVLYKDLGLKDKLPLMSEDEQLALLATDGKLVKRPLLVGADFVLVGFKPEEWAMQLGV